VNSIDRLRSTLPPWFGAPGAAPVLDAVLAAPAVVGDYLAAQIAAADDETRITTADGGWLDLIAADFLAPSFRRRGGEADAAFRSRILLEVLRPRATRPAMRALLISLTGREPRIFEPARPLDTGTYGPAAGAPLGWNVAGGWGSRQLPGQFFLDVFRSPNSGVPLLAGWGVSAGAYNTGSRAAYAADGQAAGALSDTSIYAAIESNRPAGTAAWVRIST
jgi:hypothetical protein